MSKTGHYRYIDGQWVKVSDKPCYIPDAYVGKGYWDESLGRMVNGRWQSAWIDSKEQKASLMREAKVVEDYGFKHNPRRKYF